MSYTVYIDESGDEGIELEHLEAGASPMFFFGAFLVSNRNAQSIRDSIMEVEALIGRQSKGLHFKEIRNHSKKVRCCKEIAKMPVRAFGLISDKSQLDREDSRQELQKWPGGYYNKNTAYLMELIGKFCQMNQIQIDQIIFEDKGNHDYGRMANYLCAVRDDKNGVRKNLSYSQGGYHEAAYLK